MSVQDLHGALAWAVVVANGLVGSWALGAHWLAALRRRALWWFVVASQVLIFPQMAFGVWLMAVDGVEPPSMHTFYGFLLPFTVLILFGYSRTSVRSYLYLLYGLGGWFLMGLGIRAMILH